MKLPRLSGFKGFVRRARKACDFSGRIGWVNRVAVSQLFPGGHDLGKKFLHLGGIFRLESGSKFFGQTARACFGGDVGPTTAFCLTNFFKGGRVTSGLKLCHSAVKYIFPLSASITK